MIENNKTQVQFQLSANRDKLGTPAAGTIVFIKESKELYLDGVYYGLSTTDAATLAKAVTDLGTLDQKVANHLQLTQGLVDYVANLRKFADGATANSAEGPVLTTHDSGVLKGKDNVKAAIDALAAAVDTLKAHVWTAVNKPADATGKFVTSVRQGTDGSITVDYEYVKSTDVKRDANQNDIAGATIEDALKTLKNKVDNAQNTANQNASDITVIKGTAEQKGSIANAVKKAKDELIGLKPDVWVGDEAKTLTHLRELIKTNAGKIDALNGLDEEKATQITNIIKELKQVTDSEEGDFANTLLDKLLTLYGTPTDGKYNVNNVTKSTLQEIINAIEDEISDGDNAVTGKITTEINKLDATQRGQLTEADALETGKHVGVKVVETDGKLTEVKVVEDDIASKQALTNLTTEVGKLSEKVTNQGGQLTWKVIS